MVLFIRSSKMSNQAFREKSYIPINGKSAESGWSAQCTGNKSSHCRARLIEEVISSTHALFVPSVLYLPPAGQPGRCSICVILILLSL